LASYTLLVRSSFHLAVRVAAGSIDSLAAIPAGSNTAPSAANAAIAGIVKPAVAAMIGIAATDIAESASEIIDVRRRPNLSTKVPENRLDTSSGTAAAPATIAASVALPVRSRTSQGSTTMAIPLPIAENSVARLTRTRGR